MLLVIVGSCGDPPVAGSRSSGLWFVCGVVCGDGGSDGFCVGSVHPGHCFQERGGGTGCEHDGTATREGGEFGDVEGAFFPVVVAAVGGALFGAAAGGVGVPVLPHELGEFAEEFGFGDAAAVDLDVGR